MNGARRDRRPRVSGVVLFPGAGSGRDHSSLIAIERTLAPLSVSRVDFPYRRAGRRPPDKPPVLMAAVRDAVRAAARKWNVPTGEIVIGGRSMGGRICSMVVADVDDPLEVAGLVLIAYPLAPPSRNPGPVSSKAVSSKAVSSKAVSRKASSRTEHLGRIDVPTLCVSGTRDPFGTPARLRRAMGRISGEVTWHWCAGRAHDLRGCDEEVAAVIAEWLDVSAPSARRRRG